MHPARVNIVNTIHLISDLESQIEYQTTAPVNVAIELVNQWFDDFYAPESDWFREAFSATELNVLAEFNKYYDERVSGLPETLSEMHQNVEWLGVVEKANDVLVKLSWKNMPVTYDNC